MNAAVVCLLVIACVLFIQHDFAVASPALRPDRWKRFSDYEFDYENPEIIKKTSSPMSFHARDKKDQDIFLPPNLYDDSEPLHVKMYSVPITIGQIDPERLNRVFGTLRVFEEKVATPEVTDENMSDLRSEQRAVINGLKIKKSDKYVGNAFDPPRGKKSFIEYEDKDEGF